MHVNSSASFLCDNYVEDLPEKVKYFTEFIVDDSIDVNSFNDNVKTVLSIKSNVSIEDTHLCENHVDIKCKDEILRGMLLRINLKMSFQIKYIGGIDGKSVYVKSTKFLKTIYVSIPSNIKNYSVLDLYRKKKISSHVFVEDLQTSCESKEKIDFSLVGLVNVGFII